jgi:macrolide transport system ATP-binding/permease protein
MTLIRGINIKKSFGDHDVLEDVNFCVNRGDIVGIVGGNGAGKSTLANIIIGNLEKDYGEIIFYNNNLNIGYLSQKSHYCEDYYDERIIEDKEISKKFLNITNHLGLDSPHSWSKEKFSSMSGGERTKLAISSVLSENNNFLILDEPTNHLDYDGVKYLIGAVKNFHGTMIIISHDRYFLDSVVNKIFELEYGKITEYIGNYTFYRKEKKRIYEIRKHQYFVQQNENNRIKEEIKTLKNWSSKAHRESRKKAAAMGWKKGGKEYLRAKAKKKDIQIKSKIKKLEKMKAEGIEKPKEEKRIFFKINNAYKRGNAVLEAENISKSFDNKDLFYDSTFYVSRGEKVAVFGKNGCGKTTLIKCILGEETIDNGRLWLTPGAKISYLSQEITDLDEEKLPLELLDASEGERRSKAQTILACMGMKEKIINKPVKFMSLGERTRLKLAQMVMGDSDILILDEPTNHLDLPTREELEEVLITYSGTIILISHDRYMLEKLCDGVLVYENNKIYKYNISFKEYIEKNENKKEEKFDDRKKKEELMIIENRIAYVVGEMSLCSPSDEKYIKLHTEFNELLEKKQRLVKS